uniref:Uncharacterized protein n=1 Tax=Picea glauca TaxID=3330 RepID=A0A101LXX8_PICGL|nr:hypothetical protein ABT39_MTgene5557 [Picea glauca]
MDFLNIWPYYLTIQTRYVWSYLPLQTSYLPLQTRYVRAYLTLQREGITFPL